MKIEYKASNIGMIKIICFLVFFYAVQYIPGYFSNRHGGINNIVNGYFDILRTSIYSYYMDNGVYPSSLDELVDKNYIKKFDYTIRDKKILIHYKKLKDSFELECSFYDLGKTFEVKHYNKHNAAYLYILSKVKDKGGKNWVRLAQERIFCINVNSNIPKNEYEELKDYYAIVEKEIQEKFSSEYQIKLLKR